MINIEFLKNETTKTIYNVYQWNYGRTLNIKGLDLNNDIDVQFSIDRRNSALVEHKIENDVLIVPIPNQFLTNGGVSKDFKVYAYISIVDENSYRTVKNIVINVTGCPKPDDYVYTETEILTYRSLEERVTNLEKNGGSGSGIDTEPIYAEIATKITAPTTAEVGQTIVVSEVDENGKPTAWEMADMVSGGGSNEWKHIRTVTIPEDASTDTSGVAFAEKTGSGSTEYIFAFDTDENGDSFDLNELFCTFNAGTNAANGAMVNFVPLGIPEIRNNKCSILTSIIIGAKGAKKRGWFHIEPAGDRYVSRSMSFGGGSSGNMQTIVDLSPTDTTNIDLWIKNISLNLSSNLSDYGFAPGSTFDFYGR